MFSFSRILSMEKPPSGITTYQSLCFLEPVGLFFFLNLLIISLSKLLSKPFLSFYADLLTTVRYHSQNQRKITLKNHDRDVTLTREEIDSIIRKIGINFDNHDTQSKEITRWDEISGLFEKEEPSLEEAKEAFYVFDQNRDGFIDAEELQKILVRTGFSEKELEISECREMIAAYDLNNDARIDFMEFVKFLEASFF